MKLPSLTKLPKHKRFTFEPRYYDPIKEEVEMREALIRTELLGNSDPEKVKDRISSSFKRNTKEAQKPLMIRLMLVVALSLAVLLIWYME